MELSDNILMAASGDQGDVEMLVEWLKVEEGASFGVATGYMGCSLLAVVWTSRCFTKFGYGH